MTMTNDQKIQAALDLGPLASVYVIEALRCGLLTYMKEFTDEEISNGWGIIDSPEGVRAKMERIYEVITQK